MVIESSEERLGYGPEDRIRYLEKAIEMLLKEHQLVVSVHGILKELNQRLSISADHVAPHELSKAVNNLLRAGKAEVVVPIGEWEFSIQSTA